MTLKYVRARIAEVARVSARGDDERAHQLQDALYVDVLHAIESGQVHHCEPAELAREALVVDGLQFARWYA